MKTAGIVCEYNPMHNGHVYQLEKTRESGATHIVCAMSADFVQRGECAYLDKFTRADIAVHSGADLVVEIPVVWSASSAESYAFGAVGILDSLGADVISFGAETDDKRLLCECARLCDDEKVGERLREYTSLGLSYPAALCKAVGELYDESMTDILSSPNSTLALEYIRAVKRLKSNMEILPIKRTGVRHDSEKTSEEFASASFLRTLEDFEKAKPFMPPYAYERLCEKVKQGFAPCSMENGERAVLSFLRRLTLEQMKAILGDDSGICERIYDKTKTACTLGELYFSVKTKSLTMARIRRAVINLFLEIPYTYAKTLPPYVRVLAANSKGLEILKASEKKIPVVTKHSDIMKLDERAKAVYDISVRASEQYGLFGKKARACLFEQTSPVLIVKESPDKS